MRIESLKIFCDVARNRSFSLAADANKISQSAASQIVLQLENKLGVELIDRSTRPLQLTDMGKIYYHGCKTVVEQYLELEASIQIGREHLAATLQIAAIYSIGFRDMSHYVERILERQPRARIHIEYLHPTRVYEKVLDGTADLGLLSFPRSSREVTFLPWREEPMVLACNPEHVLARRKRIKAEQLSGQAYVGFDRDLVIRRRVDKFFRDQGISVDVVLEFDNIENIKKAIEEGAGVALLPLPTLEREVRAGSLRTLELTKPRLVRPLGIIQRRHVKTSPTAARFVELLQEPDDSNGGSRSESTRVFVNLGDKDTRGGFYPRNSGTENLGTD